MYSTDLKSLNKKVALQRGKVQSLRKEERDLLVEKGSVIRSLIQCNTDLRVLEILTRDVQVQAKSLKPKKKKSEPVLPAVICLPNEPFPQSPSEVADTRLKELKSRIAEKKKEVTSLNRKNAGYVSREATNKIHRARAEEALHVVSRIARDLAEREQVTDEGVDLNVLVKALPQDVVRQIGEYLPYHVQFQILESQFNVPKSVHQLKLGALHGLFCKIVDNPDFIGVQSSRHVTRYTAWRIMVRRGQTIANLEDMRIRILAFIFLMKDTCPKQAFRLLREMQTFIQPAKKYDTNLQVVRAM
jgi:hypothetical protein